MFTDEGITDEIIEEHRSSSYFIPIARPKKKGTQLVLDTDWTQDRIEESRFVNRVRERVTQWRTGGYVGTTAVTRQLLDYWNDGNRARKLYLCQVEAMVRGVCRKLGSKKHIILINDEAHHCWRACSFVHTSLLEDACYRVHSGRLTRPLLRGARSGSKEPMQASSSLFSS